MMEKITHWIAAGLPGDQAQAFGIYPKSIHTVQGQSVFLADCGEKDMLVAAAGLGFSGTPFSAAGLSWQFCELDHPNAVVLRRLFPFTAPTPILKKPRTVGVGDRLGLATPGHIRVFDRYDAYPVLAQQSVRELTLTGRTFENVLDQASYAVFRENFTRGFGADGDHLKTAKEVERAIACGYTMITLDCSEYIRNDAAAMRDEDVLAAYQEDPELERRYVGQRFQAGSQTLCFSAPDFRRMHLIYHEAIEFAISIYQRFFAGREDALDFEVSIDETATPTEPTQHFYVANELIRHGVRPATIAPRFCGEFQKGIDYIGDLAQFEKEFSVHAEIARHFGYKISVHSGSDKFSVFQIIGKYTGGQFHVKTAGTSWLEAMCVVAEHAPKLYREIHQYALEVAFDEARKYYHVTTNLNHIPELDTLNDGDLPSLFQNNDCRQLIHITYGLILNEKLPDNSFRFRDRLMQVWRTFRLEYAQRLERHIGKHLELLYQGFEEK